jgi:membrane-associated phospholipid phosphatase
MRWPIVALGYLSYLAVVSMTRPRFRPARLPLLAAAVAAWVAYLLFDRRVPASPPVVVEVVAPAAVLLAGYWLSGLLFVRPDLRLEDWLRRQDDVLLTRSGLLPWLDRAPRLVAEYLELSYLLVYVVVPAGAVMLAASGHRDGVDRFWTVVLLAEFVCYGMLPWIQTRPPRAVEDATAPSRPLLLRRLNLLIANGASIQVNTLPSGHAAGALATALAVGSMVPAAGALFGVLALSIAVATVVGRYHYAVDSILGLLVAVAVWLMM